MLPRGQPSWGRQHPCLGWPGWSECLSAGDFSRLGCKSSTPRCCAVLEATSTMLWASWPGAAVLASTTPGLWEGKDGGSATRAGSLLQMESCWGSRSACLCSRRLHGRVQQPSESSGTALLIPFRAGFVQCKEKLFMAMLAVTSLKYPDMDPSKQSATSR